MQNLTWSLLAVGLLSAFTAPAPAQDASKFHARMLESEDVCLNPGDMEIGWACDAIEPYREIVDALNAADPWKNAVERGTFDAARAKMQYYHEAYDCRYHGNDPAQPSCHALTLYKTALETHGWCRKSFGIHDWLQKWVSCDALETP